MVTDSLGAYLADFGLPVAFSGSPAGMLGIMDLSGLDVLGESHRGLVSAADRTLLIRTDQKGSLTQNSSLTVNSVSYVIRDIQPVHDGAFSVLMLRDPS